LIIGSSQLGKLLGVKIPRSSYVHMTLYEAGKRLDEVTTETAILAAVNLLMFILIQQAKKQGLKRFPESNPDNHMKRTMIQSTPTALIVRAAPAVLYVCACVHVCMCVCCCVEVGCGLVLTLVHPYPVLPPFQVVVANLIIVPVFNLEDKVALVGDIPAGLPDPFEVFDGMDSNWWKDVQTLAVPALVLSLVGFMEAISIAKAMGMKYPSPVPLSSNQELYGMGIANLASAFFSGVPVTGGFSRTVVNGSAGSKSPMSSFISGVLLLIVVQFMTSLFENLPLVTLAATIIVSVAKLIDFHTPQHLWRVSRPDFLVFLVAFVATLLLGIEEGILVAALLSLGVVIKQTTSPHWAMMGRLVRVLLMFDLLVVLCCVVGGVTRLDPHSICSVGCAVYLCICVFVYLCICVFAYVYRKPPASSLSLSPTLCLVSCLLLLVLLLFGVT